MKNKLSLLATLVLAGCATVPTGPHVAVMPGPGKSFDQFVADDRACRAYADQSIGTNVNAAGASNVATGAAVGTALGAAAGALLGGGHSGAATGAGMGLIIGSAEGAGEAGTAERDVQRRYDIAYEQCMSAKGNQLPVSTPPTSYYRYRNYRQPVIIYQQPPTVIYQQSAPAQIPPPPGQQPPAAAVPPPPGSPPPPPAP